MLTGFVTLSLWLCTAIALPLTQVPSLLDISITKLGQLLEAGDITSYSLVELYIQRAKEVKDELHAIIEFNPDALAIAQQLDGERAGGRLRGPLHGIPILIKDNYATRDEMLTGAGSVCLARLRPRQDATVVAKLREAGAILLGKTNLSEFSGVRGQNVTVGWSPRGGQTYGAYVEHQTACGSSSGSGVAATLGLAAATLGSETAGSITCPAVVSMAVGIKPTVGLTSRFGVVPITARQDTTGPIAQSVEDAALILDAIAGFDGNDNYTWAQPWDAPPSYVSALDASALMGKRLGVAWIDEDLYPPSNTSRINIEHIRPVFNQALQKLEEAGAELVNVTLRASQCPSITKCVQSLAENMGLYTSADIRDSMKRYLSLMLSSSDAMHDARELFECLRTEPEELADDPRYGLDDWEHVLQSNLTAGSIQAWEAYQAASELARAVMTDPIRDYNLDALVTIPEVASMMTASPGLPIVTVPMGVLGNDAKTEWDRHDTVITTAPGLPLGISFTADKWSEKELIAYAYAYEQASRKRQAYQPYMKPKTDLISVLSRARLNNELR
ncbi:amidase signature domain-containing protein [Xylariaceae sp. FL0016]|nr:amidase signature domain-containing protein [Xylariaceae sp. FL0016]